MLQASTRARNQVKVARFSCLPNEVLARCICSESFVTQTQCVVICYKIPPSSDKMSLTVILRCSCLVVVGLATRMLLLVVVAVGVHGRG